MQAFKSQIIRLEENEHSCEMAQECYDQALKFGIQANFFKAIHGADADQHYKKLNINKAGKFKKDRPGVLGCFLSHYYLWKQCVEDSIPYLILEHDGYIIKEIPNNILDLFDDVLKLDRLDPYSSSYGKELENEINLNLSIKDYVNSSPKYKTRIGLNTNYFKGAYSYIIKPHAAKKLIDYIQVHGHVPADQQINSTIVDLKTSVPTLVRLHPFYAIGDNINSTSLTKNL
jgi:GR25 family glycosyltransferase involved in LPS biosynthesis